MVRGWREEEKRLSGEARVLGKAHLRL